MENWKWKKLAIDFNNYKTDYERKTIREIIEWLGIPDNETHEFANGMYSCEYNEAYKKAKQFDLIEKYVDYEQECFDLKVRIDKAIEYIEEYYPTSTINYQDEKDEIIKILKGEEK
jgi:DNA replicative helicase MCM subunit Mcm2 (Cdc46/Mcm family)